ncbi:MAG: hypothetical protein AAF682_04675 [Planctomycetota bacterium]
MKQLARGVRRLLGIAPLVALLGAAPSQDGEPPIFDRKADAREAVARGVELAGKKHKRVLVLWGQEAGDGHRELHETLRRGKADKWPFYYEFELVPVHLGGDGEVNAKLARTLGVAPEGDAPYLTILDAKHKPLANRSAAGMRNEDGWDKAQIGAFLTPHAVEPLDAEVVLKGALGRAKAENKRLFVHLGAPW